MKGSLLERRLSSLRYDMLLPITMKTTYFIAGFHRISLTSSTHVPENRFHNRFASFLSCSRRCRGQVEGDRPDHGQCPGCIEAERLAAARPRKYTLPRTHQWPGSDRTGLKLRSQSCQQRQNA